MSQQRKSVHEDDIPDAVYEAIVDRHADSQDAKVTTYAATQSLRTVLERLAANNTEMPRIMRATGKRRAKKDDMTLPVTGALREYMDYGMRQSVTARLDYNYLDNREEFPRGDVVDWLNDSEEHTYDIALDTLAIEVDDNQLYDHLKGVLTDAVGLLDANEFARPLIAEFTTAGVSGDVPDAVRRHVLDAHDERYWTSGGSTTAAGDPGLGWTPRTLDLTGIWSNKAWTGETQAVVHTFKEQNGETVHMHVDDLEALAFNREEQDERAYGAVNSKLVGNRARSLFGKGMTGFKAWEWEATEGWVRAGATTS